MAAVEYELAPAPEHEARAVLCDGGALAARLLASPDALRGGHWTALLGQPTSADLRALREGGKVPEGPAIPIRGGTMRAVSTPRRELASLLASTSGAHTFAFEANHLDRDDLSRPRLARHEVILLDETVVLLARGAPDPVDAIEAAVQDGDSLWFGLSIASELSPPSLPRAAAWSEDVVATFLAGLTALALRVYDGEGYLVWRR